MITTLNLPRNSTCWKLAGTETFRLASLAWMETYGTNLTNIEKSMRKIYWADEGKKLVQVDQAGAEALIVAYLCKKGKYRELFLNNIKPHTFVAMRVFLDKWKSHEAASGIEVFVNTPIHELKNHPGWKTLDKLIRSSDDWPAQERYYFIAKMIVHASSYGMRGSTFQMNVLEKSRGRVVLTKRQADDYLLGFHSLFPEITEWHYWVLKQLEDTGIIYNLFGYPRQLTGRLDPNDYKEWLAFSPQSTVGCITHIAVTNFQNYINETKRPWDLLGNCHDSYLAQCPIGEEKEMGKKMLEFMCQDLVGPHGDKFRMKAEAQTGLNWGPQKKDNPDGLTELTF